jgi:hypothetical protein
MTELDWAHLPEGVSTTSLWSGLHNGDVRRITTSVLERTAEVEVQVVHLAEKIRPDLTFTLHFEGVSALRALAREPWPGPADVDPRQSRDEQHAAIEAFWAKSRFVSMSWSELEAEFTCGFLDVSDASVAHGDGAVAFRLGGMRDSDWREVFISARSLTILRSDGEPFDLDRLVALGDAYWEESSRSRPST